MVTNQIAFIHNPDWLPLVTSSQPTSAIYGGLILTSVITLLVIKNSLPLFVKLTIILFTIVSFTYSRRFALPLIVLLIPTYATIIKPTHIENLKNLLNKFPLLYYSSLMILSLAIFIRPFIWIIETNQAYQSPTSYAEYINQKNSNILIPYQAVEFLKANPLPAPIFNDFNWGGYLIWNLPETKIFIDGRMDNFIINGESFARQYAAVVNHEPQWQDILNKYQIQTILISNQHPIVRALKISPDWKLQYQDDIAVIFSKAPSAITNY